MNMIVHLFARWKFQSTPSTNPYLVWLAPWICVLFRAKCSSTFFGAESSATIRAIMLVSTIFAFHNLLPFCWCSCSSNYTTIYNYTKSCPKPMLAGTMMEWDIEMARMTGFEPVTKRLTAADSTTELHPNKSFPTWSTARYPSATLLPFHSQSLVRCCGRNWKFGASYPCCPGLIHLGRVADGWCPNDACWKWYGISDLNRYVFRRGSLKPLRLPITPIPH